MPPKAKVKGKKAVVRKMPAPIPNGEIVTDGVKKQQWVIGASIGKGGFGVIYLAALKGKDTTSTEHVIKIEPIDNGPLFSELSYYTRVAKEDAIKRWVANNKLKYLAIPKYISSGRHDYDGRRYRFMVMQRFGENVENHFLAAGSNFCEDTICYLALRLLDALEFLHASEYVHADIKGTNLLTGLGCEAHRVYLVDYGLAYRFNPEGIHKEYKEEPKRAHDGTIEYTSIDAHKGVYPSRRGDLEILGYCLLQWRCGKLPWEDNLENKSYVADRKKEYQKKVEKLMKDCFGSAHNTKFLQEYMSEVYKLDYTETPDYIKLKWIFTKQLHGRDPTKTLEWLAPAKSRKRVSDEKLPSSIPKRPREDLPHKKPSTDGSPLIKPKKKLPPSKPKDIDDSTSLLIKPERLFTSGAGPSKTTNGKDAKHVPAPKGRKGKGKLGPPATLPHVAYPVELGYVDAKEEVSSTSPESPPQVRRSQRKRAEVNYKELESSFEGVRGHFCPGRKGKRKKA